MRRRPFVRLDSLLGDVANMLTLRRLHRDKRHLDIGPPTRHT